MGSSGDARDRIGGDTREFHARAGPRHRGDVRPFRRSPGGLGSRQDPILAERNPALEIELATHDPSVPTRTIARAGLRAAQSGLGFYGDGLNFEVRAKEQWAGANERAGREWRAHVCTINRVESLIQRKLGAKYRQ